MLKELILSALFATPLGLALVIGLLWLLREAFRWFKMRRLLKAWGGRILRSAQNDGEEYWDANWEEAVYR